MEKRLESFVRARLGADATGHDAHHCLRVRDTAVRIAEREGGCDMEIVVCAALLHDVCDPKVCSDTARARADMAREMRECGLSDAKARDVFAIIDALSFKGAAVDTSMATREGRAVQDADRLDALGAIGVARCFAYGGSVGNPMHDPGVRPVLHASEEEYRRHRGTSVAHFYEKLLLLKDRMQTDTGRAVAARRTKFMEDFLAEFYDEWDGADIAQRA